MKKRILFLLLCCLLICSTGMNAYAAPEVSAKASCVLEVTTGRVLYSQNENERLPMASTTKIMTALMVIESGNLDKVVTISEQAVGVSGSSIYLKKGEQFTRKSLLYALMLESGNDVAVALAIDAAGSITEFAERMNARAKELGAKNTHFVNPHGLPSTQHYTTAYDLALIAATALRNPVFSEIVNTKSIIIQPQTEGTRRTLQNHNRLLWEFEGACGVKTGFTKAAGRCLVGSAKRDGKQVVAVVLNAPDMWDDTCNLMDTTLKSLQWITFKQTGDVMGTVAVANGLKSQIQGILKTDIIVNVTEQEQPRLVTKIELPKTVKAPIQKGDLIGRVTVSLDGMTLCEADVIADRDVLENTFLYQLNRLMHIWGGYSP